MLYSSPLECSNDKGECYETTLLRVLGSNIIKTADRTSIQFVLVTVPELGTSEGNKIKEFIEAICPIGSKLIIDEDDEQLNGIDGKILAKVTCNETNLNKLLVENTHGKIDIRYCKNSEFVQEEWASACTN